MDQTVLVSDRPDGLILSGARFIGRNIDKVSMIAATIGGLLILVTMIIMDYEIFARHVMNSPTTWSLEVTIIVMVWFCFLGMPFIQQQARHIRADIFLQGVSGANRVLWDLVADLLSLIMVIVFAYFAFDIVRETIVTGDRSPGIPTLPFWVIKLALAVGPIIFCIQAMRDIILKVTELWSYRDKPRMGTSPASLFVLVVFIGILLFSLWLYDINPILGFIVSLFALLAAGVPIFAVLGLVGMYGVCNMFSDFEALVALPEITYGVLNNFALASLPLFVMAGLVMEKGDVGKELYDMCAKLFAGIPGGLAGATILACAMFAAISVSASATAATIGVIALPELARRKYNKNFTYGTLATGGTLGIMIPPSGTMILYAIITEVSLGKLFLAGVFPGIIISGLLIAYCIFYCGFTGNYDKAEPTSLREKAGAIKIGFWAILAPVIILVSIYSGLCTPLESAALILLYTLVLGIVRRKLKWSDILDIARRSCLLTGMIVMLIIGAMMLGYFMTMLRLANLTVEWMKGSGLSPFQVMALLMGIYLVLGMFLEAVSVMLITLPVVFPLIISLGFDGIWFAVVVTLTMEIAAITPPVGINLYVIKGLSNAPLMNIIRGTVPFYIVMVIGLAIILAFPGLSTWLPSLMSY